MCWVDDVPVVTSPDLIVLVETMSGEPIPNPLANVGQDVTVLALPAPPVFRCQKGIEILGPRYFGFDFDYEPLGSDRKANLGI